jgi:hypothetical protein
MKRLLQCSTFILFTVLMMNCKKKSTDMPKLLVNGLDDSTILNINTTVNLTSNVEADWSINKAAGGTINSSNQYTSGSADGVYFIKAKNKANANDSVVLLVIVTKHANVFNLMKSGGYVMSFRHANAATGSDQLNSTTPFWWKSCDPALARQITNPIGYAQSDSTGKTFRVLRLPLDTMMTSEFCRCKQTVEYFNIGMGTTIPIKEYQQLTYYVYNETNRYTNTMSLYASRSINAKNHIASTHAGFSSTPTPAPMATLNWGDCAVFKINPGGAAPTYVTTITIDDWLKLARR